MFEISVRAGTFSGVIRLCRERGQAVSWNEIAKQKRDDLARVEASRSKVREDRAALREQLPGIFAEIVKRITADVETFNAELPLKSNSIAVTLGATTARFEKTSSPAALLTMMLAEPFEGEHHIYGATLTCVTTGMNADHHQTTETEHFEISTGHLGTRFMHRGRDGAYSDVSSVRDLVDLIIRPLVYFVT
jgi:hypothetical protein